MKNEIVQWLDKLFDPNMDVQVRAIFFNKILNALWELNTNENIQNNITSINSILDSDISGNKTKFEYLSQAVNEMEKLIAEKKDLLKAKDKISLRHEELLETKARIQKAQKMKNELDLHENNIETLLKELSRINANNNNTVDTCFEKLCCINSILETSIEETENILKPEIEKAEKNINNVKAMQRNIIDKLSSTPIQTFFEVLKSDCAKLTQEYNEYVEKINSILHELQGIDDKSKKIMEEYKLRGFENTRIFGELHQRGEFEGVAGYIKQQQEKIDMFMDDIEKLIADVISKRQDLTPYQLEELKQKPKKFAIQGANNLYIGADRDREGVLSAWVDKIQTWEEFLLYRTEDNYVAIKAWNDKFISINGNNQLAAICDAINDSCKFEMIWNKNRKFAIKSKNNNKFVMCNLENKSERNTFLEPIAETVRSWELFNIVWI